MSIAVLSHDFADGFDTYTITSLYGNDRRRALTLRCTILGVGFMWLVIGLAG